MRSLSPLSTLLFSSPKRSTSHKCISRLPQGLPAYLSLLLRRRHYYHCHNHQTLSLSFSPLPPLSLSPLSSFNGRQYYQGIRLCPRDDAIGRRVFRESAIIILQMQVEVDISCCLRCLCEGKARCGRAGVL